MPEHAPGVREVLLLAVTIIAAVLGAAVLTSLLPVAVQRLIFHTPLAIGILLVGTVGILWRLASHPER